MAITLNLCQTKAVDAFVKFLLNDTQSELVISGFAGTGKTTLVKHLLDNLANYEKAAQALGKKITFSNETVVTATTHKAARVISQSLGTEVNTIHSYLGLILRNDYKTGQQYLVKSPNSNRKNNVLLFIDEASFIDESLMDYIRQLTYKCKVVFMGDPCQLISVNSYESPVFNGLVPTTRLTTVMRNDGAIEQLSAQYRQSVLNNTFQPLLIDNDKVKHVDGSTFKALIDKEFTSPDFIPDVTAKVVAWKNERVNDYNEHIASIRGATEQYTAGDVLISNRPLLIDGKVVFGTDERVLVNKVVPAIREDLDGFLLTLANIGQVFVAADKKQEKALSKVFAKNKDWSKVFKIKDTWADLRPAYASTVHKSQGSTYQKVFVDLTDIGTNNRANEVARLLYVAVSRASQQVILYGQLPDKYLGVTNEENELSFA